jgi:TRAP-type C4-dicarboxylate transport system substrate-binding protein
MIAGSRAPLRRVLLLLSLVVVLPVALAACGGDGDEAVPETEEGPAEEEAEESVTLRTISFLPQDHPFTTASVPRWIELVEEESNGSISINFVGGPESIPTEDQFDAVVQGTVDVGFNVPTFYLNQVPAGNTMHLSPFTPDEERDNGYFDFVDRIHRDAGVAYLGRWISVSPFYMWSNSEVANLGDLRGKRMRSTTTYQHIFNALGVESVNIVPPEVFTALERGLVDGFAFPLLGPRDTGWLEVTRFLVNEPFYNQNGAIIINPSSLEGLSDGQREALESATRRFEEEIIENFLQLNREEWETIQDLVTVVELPEEESDRFVELWYEETWVALVEIWGADQAAIDEAKELLSYDEFTGNPAEIRRIPCAPAGEAAADEPFCPVGG